MAGGSTLLPPRAPATQQIRGLNAAVVLASPPQTHLIEDTRIRMGDLREAGDQKCILVVECLWAIVGLTSEFFYFSDQIFLDSSLSPGALFPPKARAWRLRSTNFSSVAVWAQWSRFQQN